LSVYAGNDLDITDLLCEKGIRGFSVVTIEIREVFLAEPSESPTTNRAVVGFDLLFFVEKLEKPRSDAVVIRLPRIERV
jgi:hypothetical protein